MVCKGSRLIESSNDGMEVGGLPCAPHIALYALLEQ